jgi:hypothetical protein
LQPASVQADAASGMLVLPWHLFCQVLDYAGQVNLPSWCARVVRGREGPYRLGSHRTAGPLPSHKWREVKRCEGWLLMPVVLQCPCGQVRVLRQVSKGHREPVDAYYIKHKGERPFFLPLGQSGQIT